MQKYKIAHSISILNTTIQDYMLDHKSSRTMYYHMQLVFVSFLNIWNNTVNSLKILPFRI